MSAWTDRIDHLRLIRTDSVGPVTYRRLLDRYHTPAAALDALSFLALLVVYGRGNRRSELV